MAGKKDQNTQNDNLEALEVTLSKTEQYIEDNQKTLMIITAIIVVVIGSYWAFKNLYLAPQEVEAQNEMFMAQYYFEKDSFSLALNGDGQYFGFADIATDYSMTNAGNLASYYAGICNLHLGNFDDAIEFLSDFSSDDLLVGSMAIGATGDAYMEKDDVESAISYYEKAARNTNNTLTTPYYLFKAGIACEIEGNYTKALEFYKEIENDFSDSQQAREVKKYIARAEAK